MSESGSSEAGAGGATTNPAPAGGTTGGGAQVPQAHPGSPLPATGPIVLDASFVIALLRRDPGATALAHVLPRGVMTSVTAGEVFATIAEGGGPDPERVEGVLRALGVSIVDLSLAATRHFPRLRRIDAARRAEQEVNSGRAEKLSLASLCVLGHALALDAPVVTGDPYWFTLWNHGLDVTVHPYQHSC